mgnify:CR=1 FL=1
MRFKKKTIADIDIRGKRVFIRADFNVPLDEDGNITDDTRIRATLPTINYAIDEGAKIILASHLGRPKGKIIPKLSLFPVARRLKRLLKKNVDLLEDCVGEEVKKRIEKMEPGEVILLENLRFHKEETENDEEFAKELASLADVYVNDAFGAAHRKHASTYGIAKFLKPAVAGFLMKKEIEFFEKAMYNPVRPFVAVLGGAKVSGKVGVIEHLQDKVDKVLIGGGMAYTFLKAEGYEVGKSLVEDDMLEVVKRIKDEATKKGVKIYLPVDCVVAENMSPRAETKIVTVWDIPSGWMALDIGPATTLLFQEALQGAKTIIWNGPMGVFEIDAFSRGTFAMVHAIANSYALTIAGGGDTDVAIHKAGESDKFSYISTGGGAFLQLLEGKELPAFSVLDNKEAEE